MFLTQRSQGSQRRTVCDSSATGPRLRARVETSQGSQVPHETALALVIPGSPQPVGRS